MKRAGSDIVPPRQIRSSRRSKFRAFFYPLAVILVFSLPVLSCAAPGPAPHPEEAVAFECSRGADIGDLDGDRIPDAAGTGLVSRAGNRYAYRIDLNLSGRPGRESIALTHTDALGLRVVALDVDGDADIDLAIGGRFFGQALGVWLNDGTGRFTESPRGQFSASGLPYRGGWTAAAVTSEVDQAGLPSRPRDHLASLRLPSFDIAPSREWSSTAVFQASPSAILRTPIHLRAPPQPFSR